MEDYQKRVIDEKKELDSKIEKLNSFFETATYNSMEYDDRKLLLDQSDAMSKYSEILEERINKF